MNFNNNMGDAPQYSGGCGGRLPAGNNFLIYSLTFAEFQHSGGGLGKDFGSMNMDELVKNIWTAEEAPALASSSSSFGSAPAAEVVGLAARNLQKQGSLTLPRKLSQKTFDEVWKKVVKEKCGEKDGKGSNLQPKQKTLEETILEEFLVGATVMRTNA